jgi:CubicO group peptidase (beta-lactamase class C family)
MEGGSTMRTISVHGTVAPGYEAVAEAFERNFRERGELGAAFAATLDGAPVVDLWGGLASSAEGRPWTADTPVLVFSGTKALVAVCMLMLVERGQLDLEEPVATYWPEFAANGKSATTVADVLGHRSRLPALRAPVTEADLADSAKMVALLAEQAPERDPRCASIYHGITFGWLCGELVRRVDGRSVGRFFAEEVAAPLGLDIWIGLPADRLASVAVMEYAPDWGTNPGLRPEETAKDDLLDVIYNNPVLYPPDRVIWNEPKLLTAEIPAINGVGTPRSVARLFGCLARGGELDGVRLLSAETIELGRAELSRAEAMGRGVRVFAAGFQLQNPAHLLGPPPDAFGHDGAGGSALGAWPTERVGFSYAMNLMCDVVGDDLPDPRAQDLLETLHDCVHG